MRSSARIGRRLTFLAWPNGLRLRQMACAGRGRVFWTCMATRGALADFPCPRCLARHDQLHDFFSTNLEFPLRTTATMKEVYDQAAL
jgi:hypothetical protein